MRGVVVLVSIATLLGALVDVRGSLAARQGPAVGVFGTINGKRFKATNRGGADDPCVNGIYRPGDGILVLAALECKPKRRRQGAVRRHYKALVLACGNFDPAVDPAVLPYEIPCPNSVYEENRTGRFRQPVSTTRWGASFALDGSLLPTSNLRLRVEAFDGATVRGALFGSFDVPLQGDGSAVPAQITGEVAINFPFRIQ